MRIYFRRSIRVSFVAKFNESKSLVWAVQLGTSADDIAVSVAVDADGDVFLSGTTEGPLFAPYPNPTVTIFVAKYDGTDGSLLWSSQEFNASYEYLVSSAVDSSSDVVLLGAPVVIYSTLSCHPAVMRSLLSSWMAILEHWSGVSNTNSKIITASLMTLLLMAMATFLLD